MNTVLLFFLLCMLFSPAAPAWAGDPPLIRIALQSGGAEAVIQVDLGCYDLIDQATGLPVGKPEQGERWRVTLSGTSLLVEGPQPEDSGIYKGPLVLQEDDGELNLFHFKGTRYRGNLVIQNRGGSLLVVNFLDIERYLYGVVGREMGGNNLEALSAQAVASRSYALTRSGKNPWFDVGTDTATQVYGGYTGEVAYAASGGNNVVEAVNRTRGEVLLYDGKLVDAVYHSNAGGHTEDSENVWNEPLPYLRGVPSTADAYAAESGGWAADTYRWTKTINKSDLESKLGIGEIKEIRVGRERTKVTHDKGRLVQSFIPGTTTPSGRVTEVTVVGEQGTKNYYRDGIRAPFGLKSTLFELDYGGKGEGLYILTTTDGVQSITGKDLCVLGSKDQIAPVNLQTDRPHIAGSRGRVVTWNPSFDKITFSGRGYGHGLGMSQWGARGLAAQGYNYREILEVYYNQGKHDQRLEITAGWGQK